MGYGCCGSGMRNFLSRYEKIEMLKEYEGSLENELKGVRERLKDLEKAS